MDNYHQLDNRLIGIETYVNTDNYLYFDNYLSPVDPPRMPDMSFLGSKIREYRKGASLTQAEIAEWLGLTLTNYNPVEKGKRNLSDEKLRRLAEHPNMGVSFEQLKAWQAIDEYGKEAILIAAKEYFPDEYTDAQKRQKEKR